MNCDRLAPFYEVFEKLAFGGRLQRHRVAFLKAAEGKRRVLVVGDGDGRFLQQLTSAYPELEVDCVEMSAGMLAQTRHRLAAGTRTHLVAADVLTYPFEAEAYDAIFTHFFLDCFENSTVTRLVERLSAALTAEADWIISDFRQAEGGWKKIFTRVWLRTMYLFFRAATGLRTDRLPEYCSVLAANGFALHQERVSMAGLVASEWWQRIIVPNDDSDVRPESKRL